MPFTFAHPAAVLWSAYWPGPSVPLAAFVIGSMTPDFEYFFRFRPVSAYSHTFPGIVTVCVPLGIAAYVVYTRLVAGPVKRHLPRYLRSRLVGRESDSRSPLGLVTVPVALAIGALTHILWDGFTHVDGMFVKGNPWLLREVAGLPVYKILQHGSTLAGFVLIAAWFHRQPEGSVEDSQAGVYTFWAVVAVSWVVAAALMRLWSPYDSLASWIIVGMNALFLGLFTGAVWYRLGRPAPL